jgi:hypothetical protein
MGRSAQSKGLNDEGKVGWLDGDAAGSRRRDRDRGDEGRSERRLLPIL